MQKVRLSFYSMQIQTLQGGSEEMTLFEEMVLDALNAGDYKAAIALIAAKEKVSKKC